MQEKEDFRTAPSKLPRLDYSGCWGMDGNGSHRGVSGLQQPVGLGLELGCGGGSGQDRRLTDFTRCHGFTFLQLQELQLQSIIYKYIEAGFPVPYHLVLPIWKSDNNSFGGLNGNLYQFFPRFMGCSPLYLDNYRNGMDPEPGRCRRTDGKKWRCSKEAVPEHKYCERHMHRGRQQRSRKLVEAASQDSTTAITNLSISLPAVSSSTSSTSISPRCVL